MREYTLIKNGVEETRFIKDSWAEVMLSEYVDIMTEPNQLASACKLCGLSMEEYETSGVDMDVHLLYAVELLQEGPQGKRPAWLPDDLSDGSIGKFELCKKYLKLATLSHIQAYPYLYAIYAYGAEYDAQDALLKDFPVSLFWKAANLPITEAIGACEHIMAGVERLVEQHAAVLGEPPKAEEIMAGIDCFEKYGFFPTLLSYAGDITRLREVLKVPAGVFLLSLCVDTEKTWYQERYHEVISSRRAM